MKLCLLTCQSDIIPWINTDHCNFVKIKYRHFMGYVYNKKNYDRICSFMLASVNEMIAGNSMSPSVNVPFKGTTGTLVQDVIGTLPGLNVSVTFYWPKTS